MTGYDCLTDPGASRCPRLRTNGSRAFAIRSSRLELRRTRIRWQRSRRRSIFRFVLRSTAERSAGGFTMPSLIGWFRTTMSGMGPGQLAALIRSNIHPRANERIGGIGKARADGELRGLIPVCLEAGKTSVCVATAIPKPTQTLALCRRRQPVTGVDQSPSLSKVGLMTLRPEIGSAICAPRRFWRAEPAARSTPSRSARLSPLKEARPSASAGH